MGNKAICLHFQLHQPVTLIKYHFFDIGKNSDYYDDFANRSALKKMAENCYLPASRMMLDLIKKYDGEFKISLSVSGLMLELLQHYTPEVIDIVRELVATGCVEMTVQPYSHSLSSVTDKEEFISQVKRHDTLIRELFGTIPQTFCNTELIYSDEIGETVASLGYKAVITEGAKHVLGWKSPNFLYTNSINPKLKLLLRNSSLSNDINERFTDTSWSEWPLTADKYALWLRAAEQNDEIITLVIDYNQLVEHNHKKSGIFDFFWHLPEKLIPHNFRFMTPTEIASEYQPVASLFVPYPISAVDEERDLTPWMGNELQTEAIEVLYKLKKDIDELNYDILTRDFNCLQDSHYFLYMCTKLFTDKKVRETPYDTPYEAFINYMNILSDMEIRVNKLKRCK